MNKTILLFGLLTTLLSSCNKPDGKLSGVVTYYFNENYGDKPDVGAKIYIVNTDSAKVDFIKKFERDKSIMSLSESYERLREAKIRLMGTYTRSINNGYYNKKEKDEFRMKLNALVAEINKIPSVDTSLLGNLKSLQIVQLKKFIF